MHVACVGGRKRCGRVVGHAKTIADSWHGPLRHSNDFAPLKQAVRDALRRVWCYVGLHSPRRGRLRLVLDLQRSPLVKARGSEALRPVLQPAPALLAAQVDILLLDLAKVWQIRDLVLVLNGILEKPPIPSLEAVRHQLGPDGRCPVARVVIQIPSMIVVRFGRVLRQARVDLQLSTWVQSELGEHLVMAIQLIAEIYHRRHHAALPAALLLLHKLRGLLGVHLHGGHDVHRLVGLFPQQCCLDLLRLLGHPVVLEGSARPSIHVGHRHRQRGLAGRRGARPPGGLLRRDEVVAVGVRVEHRRRKVRRHCILEEPGRGHRALAALRTVVVPEHAPLAEELEIRQLGATQALWSACALIANDLVRAEALLLPVKPLAVHASDLARKSRATRAVFRAVGPRRLRLVDLPQADLDAQVLDGIARVVALRTALRQVRLHRPKRKEREREKSNRAKTDTARLSLRKRSGGHRWRHVGAHVHQ
eukprot:scaffold7352_cov254-Pinguiococcus_pyrenoidosus.AAC.37